MKSKQIYLKNNAHWFKQQAHFFPAADVLFMASHCYINRWQFDPSIVLQNKKNVSGIQNDSDAGFTYILPVTRCKR